MSEQMDHNKLKTLLSDALGELNEKISDQDMNDVKEYIDHTEYGVAWELLHHLYQSRSVDLSESLIESGRIMEMKAGI